ncbi:MAG: heat-shock protein Hsp20 [Acidimicrobiales bacterium]|nr:MAG: heat-shock protein Hsp20 [Acidimicrobiales bacterium]
MTLPARGDDLLRWNPFAELERLTEELNRWWSEWPKNTLAGAFVPLADIEETDDAYLVEVELPGVSKEDIDVEVSGRRVVVSGERKEKERKGVLRRRTRTVGKFHFEAVLPGDVDESGVEATLADGVLSVRLPKAAGERPRKIPVS